MTDKCTNPPLRSHECHPSGASGAGDHFTCPECDRLWEATASGWIQVARTPSASPLTDQRLAELIARVSNNFAARPASAEEERAMAVEIQTHRERMQWLCDASIAKLVALRGDVCKIAEEAEERGEETTTDALYEALEKIRTINGHSVDDDDRKLARDWARGECRPGKERIEDWGCVSDLEILIAQVRRSEREHLMGHVNTAADAVDWDEVAAALLTRLRLDAYKTGTTVRFLAHELRALREMPKVPDAYLRTEQESSHGQDTSHGQEHRPSDVSPLRPGDEVIARGRIEVFDRTDDNRIVAEVNWADGSCSRIPVTSLERASEPRTAKETAAPHCDGHGGMVAGWVCPVCGIGEPRMADGMDVDVAREIAMLRKVADAARTTVAAYRRDERGRSWDCCHPSADTLETRLGLDELTPQGKDGAK